MLVSDWKETGAPTRVDAHMFRPVYSCIIYGSLWGLFLGLLHSLTVCFRLEVRRSICRLQSSRQQLEKVITCLATCTRMATLVFLVYGRGTLVAAITLGYDRVYPVVHRCTAAPLHRCTASITRPPKSAALCLVNARFSARYTPWTGDEGYRRCTRRFSD
jgi:hypothetical protein